MSRPIPRATAGLLTLVALALTVLLGAEPANASSMPPCPASLGGLPLKLQQGPERVTKPGPLGEHGYVMHCHYKRISDEYAAGLLQRFELYTLEVVWEPSAVAGENYFCPGNLVDKIANSGIYDDPKDGIHTTWLPANPRRVQGTIGLYPVEGRALPAAEAEREVRKLITAAEKLAAPCPGLDASASASASASAPTGRGSGTTSRGKAEVLLVAGLAVTVAAAAGTMLAGGIRGSGGTGTATGPVASPTTEQIYSGDEAIQMLVAAGLAVPVFDGQGKLMGYRPLGQVGSFIDSMPPYQPSFDTPLPTPGGGQATHLAGVAFQEGPDGMFTSITLIVREAGALTPPEAGLDPADPASEDLAEPPPPAATAPDFDPVGGLTGGGPYGQVPHPPPAEPSPVPPTPLPLPPDPTISSPPNPTPAQPEPSPERPPADPAQLRAWLTSPGDKIITPADLSALGSGLFGPDGTITRGPYAGERVTVEFQNGTVRLTVPGGEQLIPGLGLPDIDLCGTITVRDGRLVADVQAKGAACDLIRSFTGKTPSELVQQRLDQLAEKVLGAGARIDAVRVGDGALRFAVSSAGS